MLQSECNCQGGGGEMDPDIMEFLISMVRTAVAQDNVREQTVLVDEKKAGNAAYTQDATWLGAQQDEVRGLAGALLKKIMFDGMKPALEDPLTIPGAPVQSKFAAFQPVIEKVLELSGEVASDLRKPKTDADVVATQGAIIELLVPPDKKGGKGSPKMQQMMQQMMAQATQARKAGGNNGKFDSGFIGDVAQGTAVKDTTGNRRVEKKGGVGHAGEWPEEFRDQLQAFFQQIEGGAK